MTLKTELLPHQIPAVDKLSKLKVGALYMEMGTGKTKTALELIALRIAAGKVDKVLWLCPYSVKATIKAEINKHAENAAVRIEGIESLSSSTKLNCELLEYVQESRTFLIVDESNLIKNHRAQRAVNIERLAKHCPYRLILNGTPISKCEKDLFMQWYILDWRILGYQSFWSFAANHLEYDEKRKGRILRCLNVGYLVQKIAPYTYQIKKEECLTLPGKYYHTWHFSLTEKQHEEYIDVKNEFLMQIDEFNSTTIYRLFTALQHVTSGNRIVSKYNQLLETMPMFTDITDNPRIQALQDVIYRIGDEKAIIFCEMTKEIEDVYKVLSKYKAVKFYGGMNAKKRTKAIEEFKTEARYFIANKACAGYGLNLQFCRYVIYYSNDWDYATRTQSEDRVHRIGQNDIVHIYDICAEDTIDGRILECLNKKERLADKFKSKIDKKKDKSSLGRWIDGEDLQQKECT